MASGSEPPTEWVGAENRWWLARIVVPVAVLAVVIPVALWFLYVTWWGPPLTVAQSLSFAGVFIGGFAVEVVILFLFPSVRRIGISPTSLIVDTGYHKFRYPWSELQAVTRTRVNQFRSSQVSSVSRTRISIGSGLFLNFFTLSPIQGERLAQFLRIP